MSSIQLMIGSLQQWLLSQGKCVSCGRPLAEAKQKQKDGHFLVVCRCKKAFIYQPDSDTYQTFKPQLGVMEAV